MDRAELIAAITDDISDAVTQYVRARCIQVLAALPDAHLQALAVPADDAEDSPFELHPQHTRRAN
jgi:hypothetical protein